MKLNYESELVLVPIEIRKDKKNFIVEDLRTGDFYEMPEICIDAVRKIGERQSLQSIERELKEKYPDEEVDLIDFTSQLAELNLIAELDGEKVMVKKEKREALGYSWIPSIFGKLFFNTFTFFLYGFALLGSVLIMTIKPSLAPHYKDIFLFDVMTFNVLAYLGFTFLLVLIHEYGHVLAMRAFGLETKLTIGHRLFLVVLETDMSSVWKLKPKDRNVLYLAGLCFDSILLFLALSIQLLMPESSSLFLGFMKLIVIDTFMRMIYQCCVYMKTDLYFVIENTTGCYNLMEAANTKIRSWIGAGKGKAETAFTGEEKIVRFYTVFYLLGVAITIALFFIYYFPQTIFMAVKAVAGLNNAFLSIPFWDSVVVLVQLALGIGLLLFSLYRKK